MNRDVNLCAMAGQRLINRIVEHLKHQMMQAGTVTGVADIHAWTLAHRFKTFQNLDT